MKVTSLSLKRLASGAMLALALLLALGSPGLQSTASAQTTTPGTTTTTTQRNDDGFDWGLLGLLGLAGLAGLRPHKHEVERVDRDRNTGTR